VGCPPEVTQERSRTLYKIRLSSRIRPEWPQSHISSRVPVVKVSTIEVQVGQGPGIVIKDVAGGSSQLRAGPEAVVTRINVEVSVILGIHPPGRAELSVIIHALQGPAAAIGASESGAKSQDHKQRGHADPNTRTPIQNETQALMALMLIHIHPWHFCWSPNPSEVPKRKNIFLSV